MRSYSNKVGKYSINVEEYVDFNELVRVTDSRKYNSWAADYPTRENDDDEWHGGSYDEARDLLIYGWDEKLTEIKAKLETYKKADTGRKTSPYTCPVGYIPHVPNALKGLPNSMINQKMETKKTKVIDVAIDLGAHSGISADEIIDRAVMVLAKISSLENSGFRVRISFLKTFNGIYEDTSYCCKIVVKNEFQPLDLKRVAFPLGHPAMFRRIMFDWLERFPNAIKISCKGKPLGVVRRSYESVFNAIKDTLVKDNQYLIDFDTDIDELFSKLK